MSRHNSAPAALRGDIFHRGASVWGAFSTLGSPFAIELLARCGFDFVLIDLQHGVPMSVPITSAVQAAQALSVATLVRTIDNDAAAIGYALDAGVDAVVVPNVESVADAEAAVAACYYPPTGRRSFGPMRTPLHPTGSSLVDGRCFIMVETAATVALIEDLVAVPGLAGVFVGPTDLAVSMGLGIEGRDDPSHRAAVECVLTAAHDAGILAAVQSSDGAEARGRRNQGFDLISMRSDALLLRSAASSILAQARS